ncbi:TetR family transcriptional regulator [Actinomadura pelletieri DSM 43383]|uniref:TetR family transcriptional regulator n=1 Tax=Actinomadura pelletieri DSM 43383 TaxID=1120940 RepID=A0A495QKG8_9ACTN|nr:TetR/AcrR family transcriptional regulator [Actinomadura pelletieri]RKS73049.1 TetR family transcriptional regulator [Actinomadura pelletieri DSM 43383]
MTSVDERLRTRATRASRRREALVDRLMDVFLDRGFAELSVAELAAALRCSKSTLYRVAASREQIVVTVVRAFFRRATERVEAALEASADADPRERVGAYLNAISGELAAASPAFFADLDAFAPAREVYRRNTRLAVERVQGLVREASDGVDPVFVGAVAGQVMESIHRGEIRARTGLDDSAAYAALAALIVAGMSAGPAPPAAPSA